MHWDLFPDRVQRVPAAATDEAGSLPYILTPGDDVLRWTNFLTHPTIPGLVEITAPPVVDPLWFTLLTMVAGAGLAGLVFRHRRDLFERRVPGLAIAIAMGAIVGAGGAAMMAYTTSGGGGDRGAVVTGLLENIYGAFDYRDEEVIYDTLERSVAGELLTEIYLETRRSLELENQGVARAKVTQVEMLESTHEPLTGDTGFISHSTWSVSGSVGHWGHIHQRVNRYEARVEVRAIDGVWKITDLELLLEERL